MPEMHVIVTGGAGYIGSLLIGELLRLGHQVTAVDSLLYGGEALIAHLSHPHFHFAQADLTEARSLRNSLPRGWQKPAALFHLAGIAGFPACQAVGKQAAWRHNVEAAQNTLQQAQGLGVETIIYPSTYSVYGLAGEGQSLSEESPLNPQSLYAETKAAAEEILRPAGAVIFRLTTLYGLSPRTRFDLTINQFVLDAFLRRELAIYQRGYSRSFLHVQDAARGLLLGLKAQPGQVFNLGTPSGNLTKDQVVGLVIKRLPETMVQYKNLTFGGDMRDIAVSFNKIQRELGFQSTLTVDDGIREMVNALKTGLIRTPLDEHYRNARFIVQ